MSSDPSLAETSPADPVTREAREPAPAIVTRGLGLRGDRGPVFGPVDLDIPHGGVAALVGPEGSGRTCLLLTLAGRMAPSRGSLTVLGHPLPRGRRELHRASALAHFAGIDDLDDGLTVHEVLGERAGLIAPLWRRPQPTDDAGIEAICRPMFGTREVPPADQQIWHLSTLDVALLQISLALMGDPQLLLVDDVAALTDPDDQLAVWSGLQRIARTRGTTVVGVTTTAEGLPAGVRPYALSTGAPLSVPVPHHAL